MKTNLTLKTGAFFPTSTAMIIFFYFSASNIFKFYNADKQIYTLKIFGSKITTDDILL